MKITLEYGDDDRQEAERALKATDYGLVLWKLDQWLRVETSGIYDDRVTMGMQRCRDKLYTLMTEYGVEFPE